ncbi:MAG: AMP-binding protein, partial [bacterium]|nr:AMP-binding protein [bacterium]
IGAVHSVVYAGLAATSLQARVEDARAVAVVTADFTYRRGKPIPLAPVVEQALAAGCPSVKQVAIWRRSAQTRIPSVDDGRLRHDWRRLLDESSADAPLEIVDAEHPLFILYTSGTTGSPKGVLHVHGGYGVGISYLMRSFWRLGAGEVYWCTSDIGWIVGHSYIVYAPLICGITTLFREGAPDYPDAAVFYDIVQNERVNVIFTAPTMIRFLMKFGDEPARKRDLRTLRWLTSAGEPLNPEAWHWARRVLCGDGAWGNLAEQWWQTETAGPNVGTPPGVPTKPGAVGLPLAGISAKVVGNELYLDKPFPHLFRTVYGDDARFSRAWDEHGYRTGDAALQDGDGYLRVVGRIDDVIKVAGHRIGSAEIEHALVQHPLVAEAAAFGVPDALKGERIICHVTLRAGASVTEDPTELFGGHVRATMGPVAAPSEVHVVGSLPKTRSGKIMRRLLRARAMGEPEGDTSTLDA